MNAVSPTRDNPGVTPFRKELALGASLLLLAMLASVALNNAWLLFTRPFWLDEYHTVFLANERSSLALLRDLGRGADFNPPALPLMFHAIRLVTGEVTPTVVRLVTFVLTWITTVLVYAVVQPRRGRLVALGAAGLLWTSPITVSQTFQGRFYIPWLLLSIAFATVLFGDSDRRPSGKRLAAIAILAALLCTIHYFGVVTWLLLCIALAPWVTRTAGAGPRFIASLAGPLALAAVVPMYVGQRAVLGSTTWVPALSLSQVYELLTYLVSWPSVLGLMLLYFLATGRAAHRTSSSGNQTALAWSPTETALFCLIGQVAFLLVFSVLVQPIGVTRYAVPALLAWIPIAALILHRFGPIARGFVTIGIWLFSVGIVREQSQEQLRFQERITEDVMAVKAIAPSGLPLIAADRFALYPLAHNATLSRLRFQLVDIQLSADSALTGDSRFSPAYLTELAASRAHSRIFGFPSLISNTELERQDAFILFGWRDVGVFAARWFPKYSRRMINPRVYELRRTAG